MATKNTNEFDSDELLALVKLDLEKGEIEAALMKIKKLLADKKPPTEVYAIAARTYAQIGLFERAKDNYKLYLKANPDAMVETFQMGMAHFDMGQVDEALSIWEGVLKTDPVNPPALFFSGLAQAQSGNVADAKQALDTLMKSAPADNLYFGRAKELLNAINSGQSGGNGSDGEAVSNILAKDAYQVEH